MRGTCYNAAAVAKRSEPSVWLKQAGLLTAIPFVLLVGPVIGYYLGSTLDRLWPYPPWGMGAGVAFGFAASVRVVAQLIQQAQHLDEDDDD